MDQVGPLPGKGNREDNNLGTCQNSHRRAGVYQTKVILRGLHVSDLEKAIYFISGKKASL